MADTETTQLDPAAEETPLNGHQHIEWKTFDDDQALLAHIMSCKPVEELVEVPEWQVKVLCKALTGDARVKIQIASYDEKAKRTDYRPNFSMVIVAGCYNPRTGNQFFTESSKIPVMRKQDGAAVERLALAVLRISAMLSTEAEHIKKN